MDNINTPLEIGEDAMNFVDDSQGELLHVDYPHEPGRLYDCAACESECYCTADHDAETDCVYCEINAEVHNG